MKQIAEKPATKIKISIQYVDENGRHRKLNLPRISFRFIGRLVNLLIRLSKNQESKDGIDAKQLKDTLEQAVLILKTIPPFELINVEDEIEKTYVQIYTCK